MGTQRFTRLGTLYGALALVCLLTAASAQATHPRPKSAAPIYMSLVPAYAGCAAPNREHGPPLAFSSCNPPAQNSAQATVGTPDAFGGAANFTGHLRLRVAPTVPGPPNEADIPIQMPLNDIRCVPTGARCGTTNSSGPADYSGEVRLAFTIRLTDHWNATDPGGGPEAATVEDTSIEFAWPCAQSASTSVGSTCNVGTSVNSIFPMAANEKRAIWELAQVRVYDGGADGDGDTTADNTVFLRSGVFIP